MTAVGVEEGVGEEEHMGSCAEERRLLDGLRLDD